MRCGTRIDIDMDSVDNGAILLFTPVTYAGRSWLEENIDEDSPRYGASWVCEAQHAEAVLEGMREDRIVVA